MARSDSPSTTRTTLKAGCSDAAAEPEPRSPPVRTAGCRRSGLHVVQTPTSPNMPVPRYFSMPPVGLEPTTFGLKVPISWAFAVDASKLRSPKRSSRKSELLNSGHVRDTLLPRARCSRPVSSLLPRSRPTTAAATPPCSASTVLGNNGYRTALRPGVAIGCRVVVYTWARPRWRFAPSRISGQRRRHNRRDDAGHRSQVGVVRVLRRDDDAEHHICERGQLAHSVILRRAWRRSSRSALGAQRDVSSVARALLQAVSARVASHRPNAERTSRRARRECRKSIDPTLSASLVRVLLSWHSARRQSLGSDDRFWT